MADNKERLKDRLEKVGWTLDKYKRMREMAGNRHEIFMNAVRNSVQKDRSIPIEDLLQEYIILNTRVKKLSYNDPEYLIIYSRLSAIRPLLKQFPTQL